MDRCVPSAWVPPGSLAPYRDLTSYLMLATALFFLYLLACLAASAVLSVALMQTGWIDLEPHRVMGRLAQLLVLAGLWPFLKAMGLADRTSLGLGVSRSRLFATAGIGWVLGVGILLALTFGLVELGIRVPDQAVQWSSALPKILQALVGGLLIGLLEETFFRGALFSAIRRRGSLGSAAVWSALLYAVVHVMKPGALPSGGAFDEAAALAMVSGVFADVWQWKNLDTVAALFAVGVFLALVRERTGHIGWCIGLHAGWVLVIQATRRFTDGNPQAAMGFLVGEYDGVIGWLAMIWIGILAWLYWQASGALSRPSTRRLASDKPC